MGVGQRCSIFPTKLRRNIYVDAYAKVVRVDDKGSKSVVWFQVPQWMRVLHILTMVSDIYPHIDGQGEPPKVIQRAFIKVVL